MKTRVLLTVLALVCQPLPFSVHAQVLADKALLVTVDHFIRAESDMYMAGL